MPLGVRMTSMFSSPNSRSSGSRLSRVSLQGAKPIRLVVASITSPWGVKAKDLEPKGAWHVRVMLRSALARTSMVLGSEALPMMTAMWSASI